MHRASGYAVSITIIIIILLVPFISSHMLFYASKRRVYSSTLRPFDLLDVAEKTS